MFLIFSFVFGTVFLGLFVVWVKELRFYGRNGWNFNEDSGLRGFGTGAEGNDPIREYSPRTRVLIAMPMMMAVCMCLTVALIYFGR
jgi:hypothetical protein